MYPYEKLLIENKAWASEQHKTDPQFFKGLATQQSPEFLWIGCSDSRVPTDKITGTEPGEIFVHRNIANLVVDSDINMLSVLQYSVEVLKVKHVIVCGHYGCGGVKAAINRQQFGILNHWIKNIEDVYDQHRQEVDALPAEEDRVNRMVEINVHTQIGNLARTSIIQKAWSEKQSVQLHGWVYGLHDGIIKPVCDMSCNPAKVA